MNKQIISVFGDILSGMESPRRIEFARQPTDRDSGFIVGCGHFSESKMGFIGLEPFLSSHLELKEVLARMHVGDVAEKEETTDGPLWIIKDTNGVVRETIRSLVV